ncbi:MAG: HDIG domain-containing protein [Clostridia bacterium]|nr:HDIG domain-containing protein [Clostridia bacterium]
MKTKENKNSFIKAFVIFLLMFAIVFVSALVKYRAYGSFDGEVTKNFYIAVATCAIAVLLIIVAQFTYFIYSRHRLFENTKRLAVICTAIAITTVACIGLSAVNLFFMPMSLTAFILVPLIDRRDAFIANITTTLIVSTVLMLEAIIGSKVEMIAVVVMMVIGIFVGSVASYTMHEVSRRTAFVLKGMALGVITMALSFLASYIVNSIDFWQSALFVMAVAFGQPIFSIVLQPVFESVFNITTNTKLTELTDHNAPLIKRLIAEAPGTFNHSLSVAGFAEICALGIGENPYLAKACAYYHDVGKLKNPKFFAENQSGFNPHDELLPEVSAQILRSHTSYGEDLCAQYRIPKEVSHAIVQHHGTLPMAVFYNKAKNLTDGEVDIEEYSYDGMTPRTKISAIIMICDASEAALRAKGKATRDQAEQIVSSIINDRIARHQFDRCPVTMSDLNTIKNTIIEQYSGIYHERVKYPDGKAVYRD